MRRRRHLDHLRLQRTGGERGGQRAPEDAVPEGEVEAAQVGLDHGEQRREHLLHRLLLEHILVELYAHAVLPTIESAQHTYSIPPSHSSVSMALGSCRREVFRLVITPVGDLILLMSG